MANPQCIYELPCPVEAPVATAQAVTTGDLVAMAAGTIVTAADESWTNDLLTTQENFVSKFLGAAAQTKVANVAQIFGNSDPNLIRVDTGGTWEYDCASTSWNIGDRAGPAKASGNALLSNKVAKVTVQNAAVGVAVKKQDAVTRVRIRLLSNLVPAARTIY